MGRDFLGFMIALVFVGAVAGAVLVRGCQYLNEHVHIRMEWK